MAWKYGWRMPNHLPRHCVCSDSIPSPSLFNHPLTDRLPPQRDTVSSSPINSRNFLAIGDNFIVPSEPS
jgi:hypothetical protein